MSVKATNWAWEQKLKPYDKLVLVELADHADVDGICWPRQQLIADRTGIHRVTVNTIIQRLEDGGYLVKEHRRKHGGKNSSCLYRLPINEMVFQSSPALQDRVAEDYSTELSPATHIEEPSVEPSNESPISADAQSEENVKLKDIQAGKKSKAEILAGAKRTEMGRLTADGCAHIWRHSRASAADDNGFQIELTTKAKKQLHDIMKRLGDSNTFFEVVWNVMSDWIGFTKHAEATSTAFKSPKDPNIDYFVKFIDAAADFSVEEDVTGGYTPKVKSTAKALTNEPQKKDNAHKPMTKEEFMAISEELGK